MRLPRDGGWLRVAALVAAAVAAALGLARLLVLLPDETDRLRDDAFYEFTWAWNVARGVGPVVSDGTTTSGVQLLWSLLLVPVAKVVGPDLLPLVAPWLGVLLHLTAAGLWFVRTRDQVTGACIALCWLGNPLLLRECQNGQETALAAACLVTLWLWRRSRSWVFCGLSLLAVLARSELLVFVLALSIGRFGIASVRAWFAPAIAFVVPAIANRCLGGGWLPDSALPMAWLWHANHARLGADGVGTLPTLWWYARPVLLGGPWAMASAMGLGFAVFATVRGQVPAALRALPALVVGAASAFGARDLVTAGWAALLLALFPSATRRRWPRERVLLLGAAVAVLTLHWAVRWYPRDYYAAPLVVVAIAAVRAFGRWRLLLLALAVAQICDHHRVQPEPLAGQQEMMLAGHWLSEVLPGGPRVGSFNSGILSWVSQVPDSDRSARPRPRIVNLDGVVDARAFAALRQRRLSDWLDAEGVDYLLDNPVQFLLDPALPHACGHWFGPGFTPSEDLVEVARFDVLGVGNGRPGGDSLRLYWRRGRGAPPAHGGGVQDLSVASGRHHAVRWPANAGDVLQFERRDGRREPLLTIDADTTAFLWLPRGLPGTGRLFVRGHDEPLLTLRTL